MIEVVPINGETWLICGGRRFSDAAMFDAAMGDLVRAFGIPERVVHGDAPGADKMAGQWGERMALTVISERADWATHKKVAGPLRNHRMLVQHRPNRVVAFPGGRGTADMVAKARAAGVTVIEILPSHPVNNEG